MDATPDQIIYSTLLSNGIPDALALIQVAQSKWETAEGGIPYQSPNFLNNNNAFGYGYNGSTYKHDDSIEESAQDIADYTFARLNDGSFPDLDTITDIDQYATLLKNAKPGAYYQDTETNYSRGLTSYYVDNIALPAPGVANIATIAGIGILLFLIFGNRND